MSKIVTAELQHPSATSPNITLNADGSVANVAGMGKVLQVVSVSKTDAFSTTSTSLVDVTGMSVSITPSSATSKIFVTVTTMVSNSGTDLPPSTVALIRDSTNLGNFGRFSNSTASSISQRQGYGFATAYLDSPNTTSATVYKVQMSTSDATLTAYLNRTAGSTTAASSSITVMEIAG
jgi:hypothetical protein